MLTNLDIHTLIAMLILGYLIASLLFIADMGSKGATYYDRIFILSKVLQLFGWSLISQRGDFSELLSFIIANILLLSGDACECLALLSLKTRKMKKWWLIYGIMLTAFLVVFLDLFFAAELKYKVALGTLVLALFYQIPGAWFVFSSDRTSLLQKMMGLMCTTFGIGCLLRILHLLKIDSYSLFTANLPQTLTFILAIVMLFSCSMGYILIKKEHANFEISRTANIDFLTNIYNRRAFFSLAQPIFSKAQNKREDLAFLIIDIDHFKQINDRFGHQTGDRVLQDIALILEERCKEKAVLGRMGGEEFAVILPGADSALATEFAEFLRTEVEGYASQERPEISVTISIGVTVLSEENIALYDLDEMADRSDQALYKAKHSGRNCVILKTF